ncbi:MAG: hypothetical protein ABIH65_01135 [Nanoarchaeota archaeon]
MVDRKYNENNFGYSEGFSELPKIDFSSLIICGELPLPIIPMRYDFGILSKLNSLENKTKKTN